MDDTTQPTNFTRIEVVFPTDLPWSAEAHRDVVLIKDATGRVMAQVPVNIRPYQVPSEDVVAMSTTMLVSGSPTIATHYLTAVQWLSRLFQLVYGELDQDHYDRILKLLRHSEVLLKTIGLEPDLHLHHDHD